MNKKYVQQYAQLETIHWWFIVRQKIIIQTLKKYIPAYQYGKLTILNVGAAGGDSSKWLSAFGKVISVENDPLFLQHLATQLTGVINAPAESLPFNKNEFDLVCAFDVLEHISDHEKALSELQRVCKPGGIFCVTVPAYQSLWSVHDEVNGHKRRYTSKSLKEFMGKQNSKVMYTTYFNTLLFIPVFLVRKLEKIFRKKSDKEKSDFEYYKTGKGINNLLQIIFGFEIFLLKLFRLPFGVSILMLVEKIKNGNSCEIE
jgi:SAM-dependent methyltransferase